MLFRLMEPDSFDEETKTNGMRNILLAVAEAIAGAENVSSLSSAVSLLASINDVANGGVPGGTKSGGGFGDLEADDIDFRN